MSTRRYSCLPLDLRRVDEVFIFLVEDIDATGWESELAVVAGSRQEAYRVLRGRGVRKQDFQGTNGRPVRALDRVGVEDWLNDPTAVYRRRNNDGQWTEWERVPDDISLDWRVSGKARRMGPGGRLL